MAQLPNIDKSAPLWMQHTVSILLILFASKSMLIDGFPGLSEAAKTTAGLWFDYIASVASITISIVTIFSKKK